MKGDFFGFASAKLREAAKLGAGLKRGAGLFVAGIACVANIAWADPPANFGGWDLVFEDNFDGTSLDTSKWNPTYNWGHTHNHRAYCDAANVIVADGLLKLKGEAKKHPDAPATAKFSGKEIPVDYTSAAIDTRGHFEVKYGYIEGRFKAPKHKGTWPAFWTLQDGWPPEIDILEIPASRKQHHYYLHYTTTDWYNSHGSAWDHEASFGGHKDDDVDRSADFHTYAVEWDQNNLNFYFDDKKFASYNRPTELKQLTAQYIIVNLAIGGWAGDDIEVTADNPAYFEADWIRVWQAKPVKPDTVLLQNEAFGTCMLPGDDKRMYLGDCNDPGALAVMTQTSGNTFRVDFGEMTLEMPNETTDAGTTVGVYSWNGKNHQKVVFENQFSNQYRLKMLHSGHYLRSTSDGTRVVQDWNDSWEWNQKWRIIKPADLKTETPVDPDGIRKAALSRIKQILKGRTFDVKGRVR
ncbi:family 16 glycosylhydrolase [Fibrobacter sp. UWEL]|uniref:family 16 glycosylhydrolase n=1 Tax=Fibrobacter sp. UWEL TaxID=1896209 RepID=UPI000922692A|nr:family 16 glycosylhydrolase [Fibrobacter sp. UWEL]SHL36536.1 Glycosyl hydrolases family 16 [Fibrobacter sp. UWEL]